MEIKTNQELAQAVNEAIKESGIKKTFISEKLGISRQALDNMMGKKHFSLDDANKILALIGQETITSIKKSWKKSLKTVDKLPDIWYTNIKIREVRENKRTESPSTKHRFSPDHKISFHLPLIHSIIFISLEHVNENPKNEKCTLKSE